MVIDSSVLIAILSAEADSEKYEAAMDEDSIRMVSAATVLEAAIVVENRLGEAGGRELDILLYRVPIQIVDVTAEQIEVARYAYRKYGKRRHPAGLNFGDCFSYALSKVSGEPLLFKGEDFAKTDVQTALQH
jgi:ribonuclease VapC